MLGHLTQETLEKDIKFASEKLLELARSCAWNSISKNCVYIMTEIENTMTGISSEQKLKKGNNEKKTPQSFNRTITDLKHLYPNLYDVVLRVHKALRNQTIVEINYYPKSSLGNEFLETVKGNKPMLHCNVAIPPYIEGKNEKFDINWVSGGLQHAWKLFWWRFKK